MKKILVEEKMDSLTPLIAFIIGVTICCLIISAISSAFIPN